MIIIMDDENLCSMCPRTDEDRRNTPEAPELLDGAPMSMLKCGHQVHTHCLLNIVNIMNTNASCRECGDRVMSDEAIHYFMNRYENFNNNTQINILRNLWNNEDFRNDVKEYKKLIGNTTRISVIYKREIKQITNRFKQNTLISTEVIKNYRREAMNEMKMAPSKKEYRKQLNSLNRYISQMTRKWDISAYSLRELNNIDGAPRIPIHNFYRKQYRLSSKYLFGIRL